MSIPTVMIAQVISAATINIVAASMTLTLSPMRCVVRAVVGLFPNLLLQNMQESLAQRPTMERVIVKIMAAEVILAAQRSVVISMTPILKQMRCVVRAVEGW